MKKILLLAVWMVFNTTLMAQQVFITEDEKVVASSIIEETPEGLLTEFVYRPQITNGKKRTGFINITAYDKKLHKTVQFDGLPWSKKENYFYVNRIYLKDKIILFYLVQNEKPAKFDVVAVELNKSTLKGSLEEKILFSGDGYADVTVDNPGKSDSDLFRVGSFRYPNRDVFEPKMFGKQNFENCTSAIHVFTKDLKLVHTSTGEAEMTTFFGGFDASGKANDGAPGRGKRKNLAVKGDFVHVKNQWGMDEKQRQDILKKIEYSVIKKDGSVDAKSVNLEAYQLLTCNSYYNETRNEITIVGMKKGESFEFSSGVQLITINADSYVVTKEKFIPFNEELVKKTNLFYGLSKSPSGQLPSELMFLDLKESKDGTTYLVWQFFKDKSYTMQSASAPRTRTEARMDKMMNTYVIKEYGPLIVLGIDDKLNQKWMNFVPSLIQEATEFRMMKPLLKIIDEKLHVYYNENREVVNDGFNVTERQKPKNLYTTCPVDLIVEPDGKMSRKTIGDEKVIGKRLLLNDSGEDQFSERNVYFLIRSHKMFALPEFIRLTY